jgi:formate hydrogenlyase transcriptional activator
MTQPNIPPINDEELAALVAIMAGTAEATGEAFFQSLVENLSLATGIPNAFVAVFADAKTCVRTLAFWSNGQLIENQSWELEGTPCKNVLEGALCHYPAGVWKQFPKEDGVESYLGMRLVDEQDEVMGHLALFDVKPMPPDKKLLFIFELFAARAAAEISRVRMWEKLRQSEQRYRDLFDEAPIAYVNEDLESRFISANKTAMRILGITPEQVIGTVGMSFVPDTPEAQQRVRDAFKSINQGADTSGVILELRRKDNGQPLWIQWWSKPDPGGEYTRTMFIDITDKVLMEQEKNRLEAQNRYLREEIQAVSNFEDIVGRSEAVQTLLKNVERVAPTDAS